MKRKHQDPYEYSFAHTQLRAKERYGVDITLSDYNGMVLLAASTWDTVEPCVEEGTQYTFRLPMGDPEFVVVYDIESRLIKTVLPPEQFKREV